MVNKIRMNNGLFITGELITVKDESSHTFPIAIINIIDSDINFSDGRIIGTAEKI